MIICCIGMESCDFDGAKRLIESLSEKTIEENENMTDGVSMFAVGVHIGHFWVMSSEEYLKKMENANLFFQLAQRDPMFKILKE